MKFCFLVLILPVLVQVQLYTFIIATAVIFLILTVFHSKTYFVILYELFIGSSKGGFTKLSIHSQTGYL